MEQSEYFAHSSTIISLTPVKNLKGEIIYNFLIKNMKIKALPKRLRELAEKRLSEDTFLKRCEKLFDTKVEVKECFVNSFTWSETPEGQLFWSLVNSGVFGEARKIYDWDFMEETLPGSEGKVFSIILDEDWNRTVTWMENPFSETYFWSCDPAQKLKNEGKQVEKSIEEASPINSFVSDTSPLPFENCLKKAYETLYKKEKDAESEIKKPQDKNDFKDITDSIAKLLEYKNKQYGNSALEPLEIFGGKCTYGSRVDEKLARVQNSEELRKNDIVDILGGLILICREKNWNNFDEYLVD